MLEAVERKRDELIGVIQEFNGCKVIQNRENHLLIASHRKVPWKDVLKEKYGESDC